MAPFTARMCSFLRTHQQDSRPQTLGWGRDALQPPPPDVLGRSKHLASKLGPTSNSKLLVPHQRTLRQGPSVSLSGNIWQVDD